MTEVPQTRFVLVVDGSQASAARTLAAAHGVDVEQIPERGIEPVATVSLLLVGTVAAVNTVVRVWDQRKGGQVIDLKPGAPKPFYRTQDVLYGLVVIFAKDGDVTVNVMKPEQSFNKVISTLPHILPRGSSADRVIKAVAETFGSDVLVQRSASPPPEGGDL